MNGYLVLTVADHLKDGFVNLAHWKFDKLEDAREALSAVNGLLPDDNPADAHADDFNFILDLHEGELDNHTDDSDLLTMQVAMKLAPDQVSEWLSDRPDPDSISHAIPCLGDFNIQAEGMLS